MKPHVSRVSDPPLLRFAVGRLEASKLLDVSPGTFDNWVRQGLMPKGVKIGSLRRWDAAQLRACWYDLVEANQEGDIEDDLENPFDKTVG
jgi:predicted DNA-binding transcriptional regulator AlpA